MTELRDKYEVVIGLEVHAHAINQEVKFEEIINRPYGLD